MYQKFRPTHFYIALATIMLSTGCEPIEGLFPGKDLRAGSIFVGADGVSIEASPNSLTQPVKVNLTRSSQSIQKFGPLPDPLVEVGLAYELEVDKAGFAERGGYFRISMERPNDVPLDELVVVVWMHPDFNFGVANENDDEDSSPDWGVLSEEGFWEVVPIWEAGDRVEMTLFYLPDTPMVFSLARGEWFSGLPTRDELDENIRRQELGIPLIHVACERGSYGDCDDETRERIRVQVQEASNHYMSGGFSLPLINGIDYGFAIVTLKGVRNRQWNRSIQLCNYTEDGAMLPGFFNPVFGKATTCLYERSKRAPQIEIHSVQENATVTVKSGTRSFTATASNTDTPETFAKTLEQNGNPSNRTSNQFLSRVRAVDNRITLRARGWKRDDLDYEVTTTGTVQYTIHEHELWTDLTSIHEYFHAVQHGSDPLTFLRPLFLEGTATASQESRDRMERDIYFEFRDVGIPLFQGNVKMNTHDYRGQDLYVYFGRRLSRGIEWVSELLWNKRWSGIVGVLSDAGHNPREMFWGYLRNQFFEAHEELSDNHEKCKAQAYGHEDSNQHKVIRVDAQTMQSDDVLFERVYIAPLSAVVYELEFLPQPVETAWFIEGKVIANTGRTAIYEDGKADCEGGHGSSALNGANHYLVIPPSQSHKVWVLAGNTATDETVSEVTVEQVSLGVEILSPQSGTILRENRTAFARARYTVQNHPARITWLLNEDEIGQTNITDRSGVAYFEFPACPTGSFDLTARITDDKGISTSHTASIDIDGTGPTIGISSPQGLGIRHGNTLWLPVTLGVPEVELTAAFGHNACDPIVPAPNQWQWDYDAVNTPGNSITIPSDTFTGNAGLRRVEVRLDFDGILDSTLEIRPCGAFLVGGNGCPDRSLLTFMDRFDAYSEILAYRDAVEAYAAMGQVLEEILNGEIPTPFPKPFDEIFASFDQPNKPYLAISQMHHSFNTDDLASFRYQFTQALGMAYGDDARLEEFVANVALVVDATLDFLLPANQGGQGGFYTMSSLTERFAYPSTEQTLRVAQHAFEATLSTWIHLSNVDTQLDDTALMATSLEAGVVSGAMAAIDLFRDL